MTIKHHLDEATLVSYAAGSMSQAMALVVACHLSICPGCRQRVADAEAIGGMLMENLPATAIAEDALEQVLACIEAGEGADEAYSPAKEASPTESVSETVTAKQASDLPTPLNQYIDGSLATVPWKRIVPGIYYHDLPLRGQQGGVSRLMRIAPGKAMLPHTHDGNELTLVLQGSFSDEIGRFTAGDIADLDSEIEHQPLVDSDVDCICLIATDAPLKFSTLLGRIMQPLTGF